MNSSLIRNLCFAILVLLSAPWTKAQNLVNLNYPGASYSAVYGVNNSGTAVGYYGLPDGSIHGFTVHQGTFESIDFPSASLTESIGINDKGDIVGNYHDPALGEAVDFY